MNRYLTKLTVCKLGGGYKLTYLLTKNNNVNKYNYSKVLGN